MNLIFKNFVTGGTKQNILTNRSKCETIIIGKMFTHLNH